MPAADARLRTRRRFAAAVAAVLLAVALLTTGGSRLTAHASGPTVAATPSSNLENGEFVTLSISGFTPSSTVSFAQCSGSPATVATDCTPINPTAGSNGSVHLNASGAGRAFMPVFEGPDPNLENQAQNGHLTCDANHNCAIVAFTSAPPSLSGAVVVPIAFAPSPELCPPASGDRATGAGAAAASAAMYRWESSVCSPPQSLSIAYAASNSPDGVGSFTSGAGTNRYAISGPWSPADAPTATGSPAQTWAYAPLATSAVVVAFLAFDQKSGAQINHLTLTPDLLAQLFAGSLPAFNTNAQVTALNPTHHLPSNAHAFARSEHDSETWEFTSWLSQTAAASWAWPGGPNAGQPIGATDTWPSAGTATALSSGSDAEMTGMISQLRSAGTGSALFALTDASTASFYGLPTVGIERADSSVTTATAATVTQALQDGTANADGTITPNYTTSDPKAWPMPMPLYALTPTNNVAPTVATTLVGFLHYVTGAGQSALPGGYVPLTSGQIAQTTSAAGAIPTSDSGGNSGSDSSSATGTDDSSDATDSSLDASSDFAPGFDDSSVLDSSGDTSDSADSFDNGDTGDTGDSSDGSDSGGVGSATAASIVLPLGGDGFAPVLPAIAGAAGLSLLIGGGLEAQRRIRRFLAKRGDSGSR